MLLLYSPVLSTRLEYISGLFLGQLTGVDFIIITDRSEIEDNPEPCINYSNEPIEGCINIWSCGLLKQAGVHPHEPEIGKWGKLPSIFTAPEGYSIPFDIFSAAFYLVSRYEEYHATELDQFGRFPATSSILHKLEFLEKPLVNLWAQKLKKLLEKVYDDLHYTKRRFQFLTTLDIDMAYKYLHKGFLRNTGGIIKDMLSLKTSRIFTRQKVLKGNLPDPFDNFGYQFSIHEHYGVDAIHFFQVGNHSKHDKNIHVNRKAFRELIRQVDHHNPVGIHPSFISNHNIEILHKEISSLARILDKPVTQSRQHFLMLSLPKTYRELILAGIDEDFTMGYSTHAGFRAGIANPFLFFDLERDEITTLLVHPFVVMDVTLQHFLQLDPKKAVKKIRKLMKRVYKVKGLFVSVWHNEALSEQEQWAGWREVYEKMLEEAAEYLGNKVSKHHKDNH